MEGCSGLPTWKNSPDKEHAFSYTYSYSFGSQSLPIGNKMYQQLQKGLPLAGRSISKVGHCLLAWPRVCKPTELEGLDLQLFHYALHMRWLWLRRTDDSRSWQEQPAEEEYIVQAMFRASIYVELGDGLKDSFWTDRWLQVQSLMDTVPCLFNSGVRKQRTVAQAL